MTSRACLAVDMLMICPAAGKVSVFIPRPSREILSNIVEEEYRSHAYWETFPIRPTVQVNTSIYLFIFCFRICVYPMANRSG